MTAREDNDDVARVRMQIEESSLGEPQARNIRRAVPVSAAAAVVASAVAYRNRRGRVGG